MICRCEDSVKAESVPLSRLRAIPLDERSSARFWHETFGFSFDRCPGPFMLPWLRQPGSYRIAPGREPPSDDEALPCRRSRQFLPVVLACLV